LEKPFHYRLSFSGARPTLAKKEENSSRVLIGIHCGVWFHTREIWEAYRLAQGINGEFKEEIDYMICRC